jgi:3(or 17)beta-hydroxysteroid dehydrogenase
MGRLDGMVAIVTGGSAGLGRADAIALAREGAKVVVTDVNAAGIEKLAAELNARQPGSALAQDVRDETRWQQVVDGAVKQFGALHVLVNNAGVVQICTPESCTLEQFRFQNSVMSEGVFLGCRTAIPAIRASGGGSIINVSSIASHLGYPVYFAYSAAKGAVRAMTKSIAVHCQTNKYNIRCNSIHPGAIETQMVRDSSKELGVDISVFRDAPGGLGQPADVANVVVFLASDESRFINGARSSSTTRCTCSELTASARTPRRSLVRRDGDAQTVERVGELDWQLSRERSGSKCESSTSSSFSSLCGAGTLSRHSGATKTWQVAQEHNPPQIAVTP